MDRANRRVQGYSLVELLASTVIIALLVQGGLGLYSLVERQQRYVTVLELRRLLNFARAEAVNRQQPVTLCALDASAACTREWTGAEIATFMDANDNRQLEPGEAIRRITWPSERGELQWRASLRRQYLVFNPGGDTAQNGSFVLCFEAGLRAADVVVTVNRGGRHYLRDNSDHRCG